MQHFLSRASRLVRIVLILVVVGVTNLVIAVIQMVSPTLWRRRRPPVSHQAESRH